MSYTPVFGSSVIQPGEISYRAIALTADVTLYWPSSFVDGTNVVAQVMDVTPSTSGWTITLPDSTQVGTGAAFLIRNLGSDAFTLALSGGSSLLSVQAGEAWYCYLADNSTAAGTWRTVEFGAGTSAADATTLAGYGLTPTGLTLNLEHDVQTKNTTYTVLSSDRASVVTWTGGTGTFNLTASSTLGNGFFFLCRNAGSGNLTVDPASAETIDGSATLVLAPTESCLILCTGSAWYTVGQGRSISVTVSSFSKNLTGLNLSYAETASEAANQIQTFTGTVTGTFDLQVPATTAYYYIFNNTSGGNDIRVSISGSAISTTVTNGSHKIVYSDATNVYEAQTAAAGTVTSVASGTGLTGGPITSTGTLALIVPMALASGSAVAPTYSYSSETGTGLYLAGTKQLGIAVSGLQMGYVGVSQLAFTGGTVGLPGYGFVNSISTGHYLIGAGRLGISASGTGVAEYNASGLMVTGTLSGATTISGTTLRGSTLSLNGSGNVLSVIQTSTSNAVGVRYNYAGGNVEWQAGVGVGDGATSFNHYVSGVGVIDAMTVSGAWTVNGNQVLNTSQNIPVARLNSGTSASASTYWRGDASWTNPFTGRSFTSTDITISAGTTGNQNLAHSLGAEPLGVQLYLVATTSNLGYAVGSVVAVEFGTINGNNAGVACVVDSTSVFLYPATSVAYVLPDRSASNALAAVTNGNWKWRVKAWI